MPPRSEGLLTASTQTVPMDLVRRTHHLTSARSRFEIGHVSATERSGACGKDVHSTKTRPPYLSGEVDARGIVSTIRSHRRFQRRPDIPSVTARTSLTLASVGQATTNKGEHA